MTARTRDEFFGPAEPKKPAQAEVRHLHLLRQAEVSADRLTGDPDWDAFVTYVQAAIDSTAKQKEGFERRLLAPNVLDHADLLEAKMAIRECTARIEAWTAAIQLPALIKKKGSDAKELMATLGIEQE